LIGEKGESNSVNYKGVSWLGGQNSAFIKEKKKSDSRFGGLLNQQDFRIKKRGQDPVRKERGDVD